jgi:predicted ATPase/class 3 adenylate cyclase/GAF domain-containing protein/tRNA A-37 threonylcarbamoyl transferase component Bud32
MIELPGFQTGERLHSGTHFSVYRATRLDDGAAVIVKVADAPLAGQQANARLEREFALTRALDDPGVASAVALERAGRHSFLVFPDTGRISLAGYLEGRSLAVRSFFVIARQVAETLGRIHARDIVHKDVKPTNILIDPQTLSVQLTDFGIAAARAHETASSRTPENLEGTLQYIAPEQTGRMNRSIDGRADLYALGVTFYEMLTQRLPFEVEDQAELVHCHLTTLPRPLRDLDPDIPEHLSRLVMKLLAKDPEDRYQSGCGLAHDIAALAEMIETGRSPRDFSLASRDVSDHLRMPERLYGRDVELAELIKSVEGIALGRAQLMLIAGPAGVGKSSLVREVMRPVAGRRGHLISGKFDQLNRGTPYRAIGQALEELVRKLLGEPAERVEIWRRTLSEAIGPNAQVVLDVIPSLEGLIGDMPKPATLGAAEAQTRFNMVFRRVLRALAGPSHPLVIFLDDLQWADGASLALIEVLMSDPDLVGLLMIGAYRDNEVHAGHPLQSLMAGLARAQAPCRQIALAPLERESLGPLIADTLRISPSEAAPLAALVTAKTQGNPFFVRQFLRTLAEKKLLAFNAEAARWIWNIARIEQEQISDNVVELVSGRIGRLSPAAQRLMQLASCIGNHFDLHTLAVVSGGAPGETAAALAEPIAQEIIAPIGEDYKYAPWSETSGEADILYRFAHDRLQQAAYAVTPASERPHLHDHIGRLIMERSTPQQREERLFEIVGHLNLAKAVATLATSSDWRAELAQLNLRAGQKARGSNAYEAALAHFSAGIELVEPGFDARLAHELSVGRIEAMYLCGRFEETERLAEDLLAKTQLPLEKVEVLEQLVLAHTTRLQYRKAIDTAVRALALLGENIPGRPSQVQALAELARTKLALAGKKPDEMLALPRMKNPKKLAAMRILMLATAPAYFEDQNLLPLLALRMVRLSARYGNAAHSAYGYVMYGLVLCGVLNDMPGGLAFGRLALKAIDLFDARDIRGRVLMVLGGFILHWNGRLIDTLPHFSEGANASLEAGDLEFHGYNRYAFASYAFMSGMPLDKVADFLDEGYAAVLEHKHEKTQRVFRMAKQAVRELRGRAAGASQEEIAFDEAAEVAYWRERDRMALAYYYKYRILKQFMARDLEGCVASARVIDENFNVVMGMAFSAYYLPYQSLALLRLLPKMAAGARLAAMRTIRRNQRRLRTWSRSAAENYLHKWALVNAELSRLGARELEAERGYQQAIELARRHGALPDEALAHELAGEFELARGRATSGRAHLMEARDAYQHWGALTWIDHLDRRHAELIRAARDKRASTAAMTAMDSTETRGLVDVAAITRAANAISGKTVVKDVAAEVIKASVMNAGATRGLLVLAQGNQLVIQEEAGGSGSRNASHALPFAGSGKGPERLVNYVARTRESVVLDDATRDETYGGDPFIVERRPLSVLCMPLLDRGELVGLLYAENDLTRGAFTGDRIHTLQLLASQAAISLENARLYQEIRSHADALEFKVKERTSELEHAYGKLREIFGKYVPRGVVEAIVAGRGSLRPTQTLATILYSDIEGFTGIVERMQPGRLIDMLNEYFPTLIEPIERNGGIVNQFLGDAMLVTFNIPIADPQHAEKAVRTAAEIQHVVQGRKFAGVELVTRIGINTGMVIAGNVGSGRRVHYAVYGDAVNLAARLEQLNKEYGTRVLVSGTTMELSNGAHQLAPVGEVVVRGKTKPVRLYRLDSSA